MTEREDEREDVAPRFTRLAGDYVVPLLNQIPARYHRNDFFHRVCDVAESLLDPEVSDLLPDSAPATLAAWVESELNQRLAMALTVLALDAGVLRLEDGDDTAELRKQLLTKLRGVYGTAREAASCAVFELGGARAVTIPYWMVTALDDATYTPCRHMLDYVQLATRNTAPGRRWFEGVADLGYVLFEHC